MKQNLGQVQKHFTFNAIYVFKKVNLKDIVQPKTRGGGGNGFASALYTIAVAASFGREL
jgi:hypothetical protein